MQDPGATGGGGGGTIFDEIRRQVEEMMTGRRPVGPQVIPQPGPRRPAVQQASDLGLVAVTVGSYWLLAVAAARRRNRARQQSPDESPQA